VDGVAASWAIEPTSFPILKMWPKTCIHDDFENIYRGLGLLVSKMQLGHRNLALVVIGSLLLSSQLAFGEPADTASEQIATAAEKPDRSRADLEQERRRFEGLIDRLFSPAAVPLLKRLGKEVERAHPTLQPSAMWKTRPDGSVIIKDGHAVYATPLTKDPLLRLLAEFTGGDEIEPGSATWLLSDALLESFHKKPRAFEKEFRRALGPRAQTLIEQLDGLPPLDVQAKEDSLHRQFRYASSSLLAERLGFDPTQPAMPAFETMVAQTKTKDKKPFAGFAVLAHQHLFGTTAGLLRAIRDGGVSGRDITLLQKDFSEQTPLVYSLSEMGMDVVGHEELKEGLKRAVRHLGKKQKLLLIDDGGKLIELVHKEMPELVDRVVAVEQTHRGVKLARKLGVRFPVVSVGDAWAKLRYESPLIGWSAAQHVDVRLERLRQDGVEPGKTIVLFGYGSVGQSTAKALRKKGYRVEVYDKNPLKRLKARLAGFAVHGSADAALRKSKVMLSATGEQWFGKKHARMLPDDAVLFNVGGREWASSLKQLARQTSKISNHDRIVGSFAEKEIDMGNADHVQQDEVLRIDGQKRLLFVHQGRPINFDTSLDPIPARFIQLTRGLLYLAALQAVGETRPGVHALRRGPQRKLVRLIKKQLRQTNESLRRPRFLHPFRAMQTGHR
jgi:S-adenosylhomocysteine hydrolase